MYRRILATTIIIVFRSYPNSIQNVDVIIVDPHLLLLLLQLLGLGLSVSRRQPDSALSAQELFQLQAMV